MKKKIIITLAVVLTLILGAVALVIGVSASDEDPALEINGANVSFEETVHLIFSVGHDNVTSPDNIKLLVWREYEGIHVDNLKKGSENYELSPLSTPLAGQPENSVVFKLTELAAAEMTENLYVRAYYVDGDNEVYSSVTKYSILQYALNKLGVTGTATESETLRDMLTTMLAYGAAAQKHFEVNTDRLANDTYVRIKVEGGALPDGTTSGLFVLGRDEVILTAKPTELLPYVIWQDEAGRIVGTGETLKIKADSHKTVTAVLSDEASSFGAYDRVVVIGLDGAGGSLLAAADTPNIDAIFENGAVTYNMLTVPTCSAHAWTSFFHGVLTEDHGIKTNLQVETTPYPTDSKYPSFLRVIREADPDAKLASIATWGGINTGIVEDGFDIYKYKNGDVNGTAEAIRYIEENKDLEVLYIHFNDPDGAGHGYGYGGTEYNKVLNRTDDQIGQIYRALEANGMLEGTLFIVTTDHGGVANANGTGTHGGLSAQESRVFFGAVGHTVEKGVEKIEDFDIRDCAGIVLYALGYQQPASYTARVPAGLFEGVKATERPTYYDADNPRDLPASGVTPEKGSAAYVDNFVDKPLFIYMPFDGSSTDIYGSNTSEHNDVAYTDGYFGEAVSLDQGYVKLEWISPGSNSFTISMWVKTPKTYRRSPILSTKLWAGGNYADNGYILMFDEDSSPESAIWNVGASSTDNTLVTPLPEDYNRGWMHLTLIVDREGRRLGMAYDFGEVYYTDLPAELDGVSINSSQYHLTIGNTPNGSAPTTMPLTVDEFMVFEGAFNTNDINSLAEYFGKSPKHEEIDVPVSDRYHENIPTPAPDSGTHLSNYDKNLFGSLEYYLPFDTSLANMAGNSNTAVGMNMTTFASKGYFGDALNLRMYKHYVTLPELKLGSDSFSVGMWVDIDSFDAGTIPILSSQKQINGSNAGFSLYFTNKYTLGFTISNGSSSVSDSVAIPADYKDGWVYLMFTLDKAAKTWGVSFDFGAFTTGSIAGFETLDLDGTSETVWAIGNDGNGDYWGTLSPLVDEFMIFRKAVGVSDLANLKDYFEQKEFPKTPEAGTDAYVDNFVTKAPTVYLPFDGSVSNVAGGSPVNTVGTENYITKGVFGKAILFANDKTFVKAPETKLGTEDFSFAFWLDVNSLSGSTIPIVSTQHGEGSVSLGKTQGITFAVGINSTTGAKYLEFYFGDGTNSGKVVTNLPSNVEDLGFIHLAVIVDRGATSTYTLYINFDLAASAVMTYSNTGKAVPATWSADGGRADSVFTLGDSGSGAYWNNLNAYIDEFMLFDYAFTNKEMARFGEYYGKEPLPTISEFMGFDPTLQLDFNNNVINKGSESASFDNVDVDYVDSPFGTAGNFTSVDHTKTTPEHWASSSDFVLSKEQEGGGYNNLTFSFWLSLATDMILDDYSGSQWRYGDRPVFATHDYQSESTMPGMSVFLYSKPSKVKLADLSKVSYMNAEDLVADADGYATYASGEHAGEYVYCQIIRFRASAMDTSGAVTVWSDAYVYLYAPLGGWTNITIVIDRGEYGVNDGTLKFYQDGNQLGLGSNPVTFNIPDVIEDYGSLMGYKDGVSCGIMINDDVGHYPRDVECYLDEFVVFDRALTETDIANLSAYYASIRDAQ